MCYNNKWKVGYEFEKEQKWYREGLKEQPKNIMNLRLF